MERKLPNLFIVGAPKCGTSAMNQYLKAHPDVFMSAKKEPHFFSLEWADISYKDLSREAYLALFSDVGDVQYAGEASVFSLASCTAADAIRAFNPDSRIIIMLRSPVEMIYSLYYQHIRNGSETVTSFAEALAVEEDRKQGKCVPPRLNPLRLQYRELGRYTSQVKRYFDAFGRDSVHVIIYDDFRADTASVYRETLEFLAVDPDFQPEFDVVNANVHIKWPVMNRFLRRPPGWAKRIAPTYKAVMPDKLRLSIRRKLLDVNMAEAPRPPLDPALRHQLQQEFASEIEALSELLDRDLMHWCGD